MNLTVAAEDASRCLAAGGRYDSTNSVIYAPAKVDLRPLREWLPTTGGTGQLAGGSVLAAAKSAAGLHHRLEHARRGRVCVLQLERHHVVAVVCATR